VAVGISRSERSLNGRLGAYTMHSRHDAREITAPARRAFLDRFEQQVDPDSVLPEVERRRRAEMALKAHMTRLAVASAKARRSR
jgi:hypothetical protein